MMAEINFRDAVELAKKKIIGWQSIPANGLAAYRTGDHGDTFNFFDTTTYRDMRLADAGKAMLHEWPDDLMNWAEISPDGFDALRLAVSFELEQSGGKALSTTVLNWLVAFLRGDVLRPNAKGGRRNKAGSDIAVWTIIRHLETHGVTATRNEATQDEWRTPYNRCEPFSGCDVVAAAFDELGLSPATFVSVLKIWKRIKKQSLESAVP